MEAVYPMNGFIKMNNHFPSNISKIQRYYEGTTIFITGATGFLGKVLVEKLLRTCYDLKRVYILVRPKKNKTCDQRFHEYFDNCLFERLKRERPKSLEKLSIIAGDCERPNLGMSDKDIQTMLTEVNCIFHVAATIRFNEKLRIAARINVGATADILSLAKKMPNLKSLIHVSTAYSFCPRKTIDEKVYQPAMKAEELLTIVDAVSEEQLNAMTPILKKEWPNTYSFTKAVAEDLIQREGSGLPIAIVRPSIVMVTAKEPVNGWVDNYYGATGLFTGISLGMIRTMCYDADSVSDQVPADYVVNNMIAAAWNVGNNRDSFSNEEIAKTAPYIPIYNFVCGPQNPITWGQCSDYGQKLCNTAPSMHMQWHYFIKGTPSPFWFLFFHYLLHVLPAYLLDFFMVISGRKPILVKTYKKVKETVQVLTYFTTQNWTFKNENTQGLWKKLEDRDKELFDFDMASLDWHEFYTTFLYGTRVYLLKDPLQTLPQAKLKALKFKIAHYILVLALAYVALKLSLFIVSIIMHIFL